MRLRPDAARVLLPALAIGLIVSGCGSSTGAKRTVVVTETYTSASGPAGSAVQSSPAPVTVVPGSSGAVPTDSAGGTGAAGSAAGSSAATTAPASSAPATAAASGASSAASTAPSSPPPTAATSKPPAGTTATTADVKNPLTVDCAQLLSPADVKKITGTTIPAASNRIKDVANDKVSSTGSVRCLYGITAGKQKLSLRITQYKNVAAATKQIDVTVDSEKGLGAKVSEATVAGQPAHVLLRDGGLVNVQYGTWTLAIAVSNGVMKGDQADQLTQLAQLALTRVIKNG